MVKLNKIYTRTGDDGTTGLAAGPRRKKFDLRVAAYGTVDEANSVIGIARLHTADAPAGIDAMLMRMQNDLFDLGADLSLPPTTEGEQKLRVLPSQTEWLEGCCDEANSDLEPLRSFVLPGGSPAAAALHICRTVSRRAERRAILVEDGNPEVVRYLNRLSDLFFILARVANAGGTEPLWQPGASQD